MRKISLIYASALVTLAPAMAWANPNTDSPEPSLWAFLALGAVPLAWVAWRTHQAEQKKRRRNVRIDGR